MKKKKALKKNLENFLKDESGNISRDKVLKIGLGTISALGIMAAFTADSGDAGYNDHTSHANSNPIQGPTAGGDSCVLSHSNVITVTDHNSY